MRWAGCPGKRPRRGLKWELEKDRGAEAGWGSPGRGMKTGKARPISTRSSLVRGGLCASERPRGWAAGSRPQPVRAPATTCPAPARRPPRTPELVLPIGGSETRWAGAPAAPPPSRGLGQPLLLPGPPSPHLSAGWPQARPRLRGRRGGGGPPCLRGQHVGAAEGGRRCPRTPSACRRRPAPRSFWGGATGRPFICLQVARDAEGLGSQPAGLTAALRPAAGTRPGRGGPAASARAGAAEPEPKHPVESGRLLGASLEQSASDGVGRAAGRPGRAAVAGRRRGRGNLGRLRGHKGRKYLELDDVRGSHSGDA